MKRLLLCALALLLFSGCSSLIPVPDAPEATPKLAEEAWARVLKSYVDEEGRVDFIGLGKNLGDLKVYARYVSKADTKNMVSGDARLAFYLNAYNALSMYNVILYGYPDDLGGFFTRAKFFALRKFTIAGEERSLYSFENDIIRKVGDPRVHVALNCMSAGCPRLPREPFSTLALEAQLDREAKKFYNEPRNVWTDAKEKVVHISEILDFFTADFLAKKPTLIEYVNGYRREKVPADYKVTFIPYNWTIYKQPVK